MRTQKQDILDWFRAHKTLTRMQSYTELGVCELSSRIGELERDGHKFHRKNVQGTAKNGRKYTITEYSLIDKRYKYPALARLCEREGHFSFDGKTCFRCGEICAA